MRTDKDSSTLRPKFLGGAGFYKSGAIVEIDDGPEYIRCSLERVEFDLANFERITTFKKVRQKDGEEPDELSDDDRVILRARDKTEADVTADPLGKALQTNRRISGIAKIASGSTAPYYNDRFCFSAFGSDESFQRLNFGIHEDNQSCCSVSHIPANPEYGRIEGFAIELSLDPISFGSVWEHVVTDNSQLGLIVSLDSPSFYAQWSPRWDGRLIKYLGHNRSDLVNYDELPDHFKWTGPQKLRFDLSLVSRCQPNVAESVGYKRG